MNLLTKITNDIIGKTSLSYNRRNLVIRTREIHIMKLIKMPTTLEN